MAGSDRSDAPFRVDPFVLKERGKGRRVQPKFREPPTPEVPRTHLPRDRLNGPEDLAPLAAADAPPRVPSLDDETVGTLPEANDDELGDLRAEEVRGARRGVGPDDRHLALGSVTSSARPASFASPVQSDGSTDPPSQLPRSYLGPAQEACDGQELAGDHGEANEELLGTEVAAVELINVLRPVVAVARYVIFAALALHEHPECRDELRTGGDTYLELFVQKVRRFYPFFPFAAGRAREEFVWRGAASRRGRGSCWTCTAPTTTSRYGGAPKRSGRNASAVGTGAPSTLSPRGAAIITRATVARASGSRSNSRRGRCAC